MNDAAEIAERTLIDARDSKAATGVAAVQKNQNNFKNTTSATNPFCALRPIVLPMSSRSSVPYGPTVWPAMPRPWNGSRSIAGQLVVDRAVVVERLQAELLGEDEAVGEMAEDRALGAHAIPT